MNNESLFANRHRTLLYKSLCNLNAQKFKIFYGLLVYCWGNHKYFISNQNFFNLWCELNLLCHELDESFPDQYDNYEEVRSFCHSHPYYFVDILPIKLISLLFTKHIDNQVDILINIAKKLFEEDIYAAYIYANEELALNDPVESLVIEAQEHIKCFS